MKKLEAGYTLIEVCMSIVLFALFIGSIGHFYAHIYEKTMVWRQQTLLAQQANAIEVFIQEAIREASAIKIYTEDEVIEPIGDWQNISQIEVTEKLLMRIEFKRKIKQGATEKEHKCSIKVVQNKTYGEEGKKGKCKLIYVVEDLFTYNVVADQIEWIKVSKRPTSNQIVFDVLLKKRNETNEACCLQKYFFESIQYKGYIS